MSRNSFAPGKIILSGEYGALFGYGGIAVPSSMGVKATYTEDLSQEHLGLSWKGGEKWLPYVEKIVAACKKQHAKVSGRLTIHTDLPIGKGMGSSTALVIAVARA